MFWLYLRRISTLPADNLSTCEINKGFFRVYSVRFHSIPLSESHGTVIPNYNFKTFICIGIQHVSCIALYQMTPLYRCLKVPFLVRVYFGCIKLL